MLKLKVGKNLPWKVSFVGLRPKQSVGTISEQNSSKPAIVIGDTHYPLKEGAQKNKQNSKVLSNIAFLVWKLGIFYELETV